MVMKLKQKLTYQEYAELPEGSPYQLMDGELIMVPAPTPDHQRILRKLGFLLLQFVEEKNLGEIFYSPIDVYFTEHDTFQPDIVFISTERLSIIGQQKIEQAPDLVIEILSPSSAYYDTGRKFTVYEQSGVREYWLVHPERKKIEIYTKREAEFQLVQAEAEKGLLSSVLLEGFSVVVEQIFS